MSVREMLARLLGRRRVDADDGPVARALPAPLVIDAAVIATGADDDDTDSGNDSGSPAPMVRRQDPPLEVRSADTHAHRLLAWLADDGVEEVFYGELFEIYREMCLELWWAEQPWVKVAAIFNRMTGGKRYRNIPGTGGRKVRVYRIAEAAHQPLPMAA